MKLTPRDLLALINTGASQRTMATLLGVSPRSVGRYLSGERKIPDALTPGVESTFTLFKAEAKANAKAQGVPFNVPVWVERPFLRKINKRGEPIRGDRVIVRNTENIRPELRVLLVQNVQNSGKVQNVSVRSQVNLKHYFKSGDKRRDADPRRRLKSETIAREQFKELKTLTVTHPVYTLYADASGIGGDATENVERYLREKHEPSATQKGGKLADAYLFQLTPQRYEPEQSTKVKARPRNRKGTRGRGNK